MGGSLSCQQCRYHVAETRSTSYLSVLNATWQVSRQDCYAAHEAFEHSLPEVVLFCAVCAADTAWQDTKGSRAFRSSASLELSALFLHVIFRYRIRCGLGRRGRDPVGLVLGETALPYRR